MAISLAGLGLLAGQARAATLKTWAGAGADALWSTAANWSPSGVPVSGDNLVFNVGAPRALNTNDLVGLSVGSVTFHGGPSGFQIYGNTLFITGTQGIGATGNGSHVLRLNLSVSTAVTSEPQLWPLNQSAGGQFNFYGNIQLGIRDLTLTNNANVTFWGILQGSGNLTNHGTGAFTLAGSAGNTFTGRLAVRDNPNVVLSKTTGVAVPGDLVVTGGGVVRLLDDDQIEGDVTLLDGSTLHLDGHQDAIGALQLKRSSVQTGAGQLTLGGDVTVSAPEVSTISGRVSLGASSRVLNVADADGRLELHASLSGAHTGVGFTKTGPGFLRLLGTNTYAGVTRLQDGLTTLLTPQALGSTLNGTVLEGTAELHVQGAAIGAEALTIDAGRSGGSVVGYDTCSWEGGITFNSDGQLGCVGLGEFNLNGPLSGPGNVLLNRNFAGDLRFNGAAANTVAGAITLANGRLILNKSPGVNAVSGPLVVGRAAMTNDAIVRLAQNDQIAGAVTLWPGAVLHLNDHAETLPALSLQGADIFTGTGTLTLAGGVTNLTSDGFGPSRVYGRMALGAAPRTFNCGQGVLSLFCEISGSSAGTMEKLGLGVLRLETNNTFNGAVRIYDGTVTAQTSGALGSTQNGVFVGTNATLSLGSDSVGGNIVVGDEAVTLQGDDLPGGEAFLTIDEKVSWNGPLIVNRAGVLNVPTAVDHLSMQGRVSGSGALRIMSSISRGTVVLAGTNDNVLSGPLTLLGGTLVLSNTRPGALTIPGVLQVNQPGSTNVSTLRWERNFQFGPNGALILEDNAAANLNDHRESLALLDLRAPVAVNTGAGGQLAVPGQLLVVANLGSPARINGELNLPTGTTLCDVSTNSVLDLAGAVTGSGHFRKLGSGVLTLLASNSFTGDLTVSNGFVFAGHAAALGSSVGHTYVLNRGTLELWGGRTFAERIHASGSGQAGFGALYSGGGSNLLTQPLDLTTDVLVAVDAAGDVLNLGGGTTGGRVLLKDGAGILELSGGAAGGITGLYLNEGTVRVSTPNQIADHAHVNVSSNTTLRLVGTGGSETIGSLAGSGTVQLGGNRLLLGGNGNDTMFSGTITGTAAGDAGLTKLGAGEFTLTGDNSYPGDTLVVDGRLTVHGDQRQSRVVVSSGGRLGGTGRVGNVNLNVGGGLAPGASPGRLTVSNLVCAAETTLRMELEGPTVATQYDQVDVNGQFNPNNSCELVVALNGYEPPEGTIFNLVRNDGAEAVLNAFKDFPEGATFTVDNTSFRISYRGGTGNDVTLTVIELPSINNPRLRIAAVGDQVQVRWPTNATGFVLERTAELGSTNWVTTSNNILVDGRFFVHTNAANAGARYWRLRK